MKEAILNWFKYDRSFNTGVLLYFKYGHNRLYINRFNIQGSTKQNMEALLEQLRVLANIDMLDYAKMIKSPVKKQPEVKKKEKTKPNQSQSTPETREIRENLKSEIKLRDEFPFLNQPDCPNELKILIADKITAFRAYKEAHQKLFDAGSPEEEFKAVKDTVENFILNRQIYKELDYYKKHHKILGEHPLFAKIKIIDQLQQTNTVDLAIRKDNLLKYIRRNRENIEKNDKPHLNKKRFEAIDDFNWELSEIEKILKTRK